MTGRTIIDKIWDTHVIRDHDDGTSLLHLDRIVLHERTGPLVLSGLEEAGYSVANPRSVLAVMDHIVDTTPSRSDETLFQGGRDFIEALRSGTRRAGIRLFDLHDSRQGIAHVVAPEQGFVLPGMTAVCGDSHTCTLGGLGALAWGIGSTEGEHAVATQTLVRRRPPRMRAELTGKMPAGVSAKDLILALIGRYGANGGAGHAIEFAGESVRALNVEGRMTLCNMAVEFGAWTGLVAPDDLLFDWIAGRPDAPCGENWEQAVLHWRSLASDEEARWDAAISLACGTLAPQVTWGISSDQVIAIDDRIPDPTASPDADRRNAAERALSYMGLLPGQFIADTPIEAAFIGSCTNSRLPDLIAAARVVQGRRVAPGVKALVVPGSMQVKRDAEALGLNKVFRDAGFEWRESGCSLCFYSGGETFGEARRVITSTNRNFENRQGRGVRSHLASPATVAASAITGRITDPRQFQ